MCCSSVLKCALQYCVEVLCCSTVLQQCVAVRHHLSSHKSKDILALNRTVTSRQKKIIFVTPGKFVYAKSIVDNLSGCFVKGVKG